MDNLSVLLLAGVVQRLEQGTHKPQTVVRLHSSAHVANCPEGSNLLH